MQDPVKASSHLMGFIRNSLIRWGILWIIIFPALQCCGPRSDIGAPREAGPSASPDSEKQSKQPGNFDAKLTLRSRRVPIDESLLWVSSGAWYDQQIVLVDVIQQKLFSITEHGKLAEDQKILSGISTRSFPPEFPASLKASPRGYFLVNDTSPSTLLWFSKDFVYRGSISPHNDTQGLARIYDAAPTRKGILAFGDIKDLSTEGSWVGSRFVYFDAQGAFDIYDNVTIAPDRIDHYTLNVPYIAAIDDLGYILIYDDLSYIVEIDPEKGTEPRKLPLFPEDFQRTAPLQDQSSLLGPERATARFREFEQTRMITELHSWQGTLFLTGRQPDQSGGSTVWWLIAIDPKNGKEKRRIRLPVNAYNLLSIPGDSYWCFLEKGRVQALGRQRLPYMEATSMVLVPANCIDSPSDCLSTHSEEGGYTLGGEHENEGRY